MFIAVRCPLCLLTVYTIFVDNGPNLNGFSVMSLADEDLPFYNCPMPLCGFHIPTFHFVNLYLNPTIKHLKHSISMGLNVAARTNDTRPFRSPSQVAALAITLDRDERQKPPVVAWQAQVTKGQPLEGQPLEEQPLEEQPLREQPLKEQPLKERPLREQPLEEQHIKEQPPQEQPPEAQPLEEQPLEEQPAEKQASQDIGHRDSQGGAAMPAVADTVGAP